MTKNPIPASIAIIMDGNRRWARARDLSSVDAYNAGLDALAGVVAKGVEVGVKYITVFAFSTENWQRNKSELDVLMRVAEDAFSVKGKNSFLNKCIDCGISVHFVGKKENLSHDILKMMQIAEEQSADGKKMLLNVAFNYSSKQEILHAANEIARSRMSSDLTEEEFEKHMLIKKTPDPDLLIRTGGEQRLSNFLLWQLAYSELWFSKKMWPDFMGEDLLMAINDYCSRERRYGK